MFRDYKCRIAELEAERDKLKQTEEFAIELATSIKENFNIYKDEFTIQSKSRMADMVQSDKEAGFALFPFAFQELIEHKSTWKLPN